MDKELTIGQQFYNSAKAFYERQKKFEQALNELEGEQGEKIRQLWKELNQRGT